MITETIGSITIVLPETEGLFSPRGLDRGTRAMLELYPPEPGWRVLDLGCGAGPVGIYAFSFVSFSFVSSFFPSFSSLSISSAFSSLSTAL